MEIYEETKKFPREELYSLTDQIRRASRSVPGNIGEGYRRRLYPKIFVNKMSEADGEGAETQVWIDFALPAVTFPQSYSRDGGEVTKKSAECLVV